MLWDLEPSSTIRSLEEMLTQHLTVLGVKCSKKSCRVWGERQNVRADGAPFVTVTGV